MIYGRSFLILALAGALAGCLRTAEPVPGTSLAGDALAALHIQYGVASQVFTYDSQGITIFRTAGGGVLATGYQAFLDMASNSPAPGPLRLELREVVTRADMLLSGRPSMGQGEVLESGGQYLVQASTAGRQLLRLSPRLKLGLAVPLPALLSTAAGLALYAPDKPGNLTFNWVPAPDTASSVGTSVALAASDPIYLRCLIAKGLYDSNNGWLSFARPLYSSSPATTVRVRTGQPTADAGNTLVYLVFHDYNAVAQLAPTGGGDFELANVPGATAVTVFALHTAAGKLYLGQREDTVRAGRTFSVALAEHSAAEIAAAAQRFH